MSDRSFTYDRPYDGARAISTSQLLGQVMFLVAIGIAFLALGSYVGRDLALNTARILSFVGFGMLILSSFAGRIFRVGPLAMAWFFGTALVIGLGLGPVLQYFATVDEAALTQAAGGTALIVLGCGAGGFALSKDLAGWMRPLSFVVLGLVGVSLVLVLFGSGGNPLLSLATGIFVSIVNIFLSLLNLFSNR